MATTIERPVSAQVVAHATEYPADRDGDGTGYDRKKKRNTAERRENCTEELDDIPAVLVDSNAHENHTLDGAEAYRAAAMQALEPGIDHSHGHPLRGPDSPLPADSVRHAYEHYNDTVLPHEVNLAT